MPWHYHSATCSSEPKRARTISECATMGVSFNCESGLLSRFRLPARKIIRTYIDFAVLQRSCFSGPYTIDGFGIHPGTAQPPHNNRIPSTSQPSRSGARNLSGAFLASVMAENATKNTLPRNHVRGCGATVLTNQHGRLKVRRNIHEKKKRCVQGRDTPQKNLPRFTTSSFLQRPQTSREFRSKVQDHTGRESGREGRDEKTRGRR